MRHTAEVTQTGRSRATDRGPELARRPALAFVLVLGSLWHFVHAWSGGQWLVGLVAPVNESVWEHTKLVAFPLLVLGVVMAARNPRDSGRPLGASVAGSAVGALAMVVGFYSYVAVSGLHLFVLDLALFVACAWLAVTVMSRVLARPGRVPPVLGVGLAVAQVLVLAVLTEYPPHWPLFGYG